MDQNTQEIPKFTSRHLRDMFGLFPTGVAIVTAVTPDASYLAATVSSFSTVSLDPPLILFSMARSSKSFEGWSAVSAFAVNILSEDQRTLSSQFAQSVGEKWQGVEPEIAAHSGLPLIPGALGTFQCRTWAKYDGGDHLIIVGEIFEMSRSEAGRPLIFSGSRYSKLAEEAFANII